MIVVAIVRSVPFVADQQHLTTMLHCVETIQGQWEHTYPGLWVGEDYGYIVQIFSNEYEESLVYDEGREVNEVSELGLYSRAGR